MTVCCHYTTPNGVWLAAEGMRTRATIYCALHICVLHMPDMQVLLITLHGTLIWTNRHPQCSVPVWWVNTHTQMHLQKNKKMTTKILNLEDNIELKL